MPVNTVDLNHIYINRAMPTKTFEGGDFKALHDMLAWCAARGFSVGHLQAHEPTGILFGVFDIQKWRNLSGRDRSFLHAIANGDYRNGPITIRLMPYVPITVVEAFTKAPDDAE
jgi:hypothetical protein